jgi:predicted HicB family RNase H-like nuclease
MNKQEYLEWCKKWGFEPHVTYVGGMAVKWEHGKAGAAVKKAARKQTRA